LGLLATVFRTIGQRECGSGDGGAIGIFSALLSFSAASIALAMVDLRIHRLPDAIALPGYPLSVCVFVVSALLGETVSENFLGAGLATLIMFGLYLLLALLGAGVGGGDIKLAGLLGF